MRHKYKILFLLFLVMVLLRLGLSFGTEHFSDAESYYYLSNLESSILSPDILRVISELFFGSLIFIVFFIALELSSHDWGALLSALLAVFTPLFFKQTFNALSIYTIIVPLFFFTILCFLKLKERQFQILFVLSSIILAVLHQMSLILLLVILFYLFVLFSEGGNLNKEECLLIFGTFFLIIVIRYFFGIGGNLIFRLIEDQFYSFTLTSFTNLIGFVKLFFGVIGLYFGFFRQKSKKLYLITGLVLSIIFLLSFRLITFSTAIIFLGVALAIPVSITIPYLIEYCKKTKLPEKQLPLVFITLVILFSIIPSVKEVQSKEPLVLEPIFWLRNNTPHNSVILSNVFEGVLINYFADRSVLLSFPYAEQFSHQRFKDIRFLYATMNFNKATKTLKDYEVNYIYFSNQTKGLYKVNELKYVNDKTFNKVYDDSQNQIWVVKNV